MFFGYLKSQTLKEARDKEGKELSKYEKIASYPFTYVGRVLSALLNFVFGTFYYKELPRTSSLIKRIKRNSKFDRLSYKLYKNFIKPYEYKGDD